VWNSSIEQKQLVGPEEHARVGLALFPIPAHRIGWQFSGIRGEGTAEESPPGGGVMDETDYFRLANNAELTLRQCQAYIQRSESPRFPEESLHLGMRAAVDQAL